MEAVKVVATSYKKERLIIDEVDSITASMTAQVLNNIRAKAFLDESLSLGSGWWFYSAQPDEYQVKHGA